MANTTLNHYNLAINEIKKMKGKKLLLEFGSGGQFLGNNLPKNISYHSADYDPLGYFSKKNKYNINLNSEKLHLPIKSNSYDLIVCNETIEHLLYPTMAIKEMIRIGKPHAVYFFSMPNEYNFVMRIYYLFGIKKLCDEPFQIVEKFLHVHHPRVKDILELFEKHFVIEKVEYIWQSRSSMNNGFAKVIDKVINALAQVYPSLFARVVVLKCRGKNAN